jgi:hypothetical protein
MDLAERYEIKLSNTLHGWNVEVYYDLRNAYSYKAWRKCEQRTVGNIRSIGFLIDHLEGVAVLTQSEIADLHEAYLKRIPNRDVRQKIDLSGGRYHWLTLTIDFGPFSEVNKSDLSKVLSVMWEHGIVCNTSGKVLWQNELAFRSYVIIFHELVHLQQDLTTGLGAWDWTHVEDEKLAQLRRASKGTVAAMESIQSPMFYGGRTEMIKEQEDFVRSSLECMFGEFGKEFFQTVTIESILEAEAVASTYVHLQASVFCDSDEEHISRAQDAFHPARLPPIYSSVLQYFVNVVVNSKLRTDPASDLVCACVLTAFSCDLSLAVPPPGVLSLSRDSQWEFDPRLSLARTLGRLIQAIQSKPDKVKACVSSLNFVGLASVVLDNIPTDSIFGMHSSSSYKAIYQGWVDFFNKQTDHIAIDVLRAEVMRMRSKDPFRFSLKNRHILDVPYIAFNAGYRSHYLEGLLQLRPDLRAAKKLRWRSAFISHITFETAEIRAIERLIDYYQFGLPFRCPFATSPNCKAWTGGCLDGWISLDDLPPLGCLIREFCQEALLPIKLTHQPPTEGAYHADDQP